MTVLAGSYARLLPGRFADDHFAEADAHDRGGRRIFLLLHVAEDFGLLLELVERCDGAVGGPKVDADDEMFLAHDVLEAVVPAKIADKATPATRTIAPVARTLYPGCSTPSTTPGGPLFLSRASHPFGIERFAQLRLERLEAERAQHSSDDLQDRVELVDEGFLATRIEGGPHRPELVDHGEHGLQRALRREGLVLAQEA